MFARAVARTALFVDAEDMETYLRSLAATVGRYGWKCLAYCLMGNHMHLLIETPEPNLGFGMQWNHGQYARHFNQRHRASGHRFDGRYGNRRAKSDRQLYAAVRYIARNPVEAGMVSAPEEWLWGSHRAVLLGAPPDWLDVDGLLGFFGALGGTPLDRYRQLVEAA